MGRLPSWDEFLNPPLHPRVASKASASHWNATFANGHLAEQAFLDRLRRYTARASFLDHGGKDLLAAHATTGAATHSSASTSHTDFLFGQNQSPELFPHVTLASPRTIDLKTAMMIGPAVPARPGRDEDDECHVQEKETGFFRIVPRSLNLFAAADLLSLFVILSTRHMDCDVPLSTWLAGGIIAGFPVSYIVHSVA